jgi:hypothetical protein
MHTLPKGDLLLRLLALLSTLALLASFATSAQPMTTPLLFELDSSARVAGLGGAFLALSDDESATYYNPAGLAFLKQRGVSALYSQLFETIDYLALGMAIPYLGIQAIHVDSGGMPVYNDFGNPTSEMTNYLSQAGMLAAALPILEELGLGGRVKAYQTQAGDWHGFGWSVDAAVLLRWSGLRLGAVIENIAQQPIRYNDSVEQSWPQDFRIGGAYSFDLKPLQITLALDATHLMEAVRFHLGAEVWIQDVGIRLGYNGISLTAGASVHFKNFRLDWAYALHPQLPTSHLMTVVYRF